MTKPKGRAVAKPVPSARRKPSVQSPAAIKRNQVPSVDNDEVVIDRVLKAATTLLTTKGLPAFNMNAVAALAAVDLPTLHRHFKDKTLLLKELHRRAMTRNVGELFDIIRSVKRSDVEQITIAFIHRQIDRIVDMQLAEPEIVILRQTIRAIPELAELDERSDEAFASVVENVLITQLPDLNPKRARSMAFAIVEAGTALIELCARRPKDAREIAREVGVMIIGYIREVIAPQGGT